MEHTVTGLSESHSPSIGRLRPVKRGYELQWKQSNGSLYLGDSLEWLASMKSKSVDMVFADPPYNIKKAEWDNFESQEKYIEWSLVWIKEAANAEALSNIDGIYRELHGLASKSALRSKYQTTLKGLKKALSELARDKAVELSKPVVTGASDIPPVFSSITVDAEMQRILSSRWNECAGCVEKGFPLAGIVMIGGLLETVLLARVNLLTDQAPVFKAAAAPKDKKSGNPLPLKDWGLRDFIDVACELKWITETHKDVSVILRDYRNYIHPHKEYQHKKRIEPSDAGVLWDVGKTMMRQLLKVS